LKEIKAIIQPFMLGKVVAALKTIENLAGITVSEVRGFGRTRAQSAPDAIVDDAVQYVKKSKLEVVVPDDLAERVVAIIQQHAQTGNLGDGKIFVYRVDEIVRIRTGERGDEAI
jgi:nitrogen regulatory protein P-II 1